MSLSSSTGVEPELTPQPTPPESGAGSDQPQVPSEPGPTYPPPSMGLVNQGCTCYLNSLLQLLYHLSFFRKAVYGITLSSTDDESSKIPRALQELFFQMQERRTAPTTKGLTDAFGWDEREVFVQHDIQEMLTLLRDCLESKMKGTPSEGAMNRLFEGFGEQVVETMDRTYCSRRKDTFFDVHLPIQGFRSVEESLRSLIEKEQLVGDNKYRVEEDGKPVVYKDAEKGYRFVQFPPALFFHLKRFEMDLMSPTLDMKKINSGFEFSETLDLRAFETGKGSLDEAQEKQKSEFDLDSQAVYDLHGVIVHSGTAHSGHYYCYIRHWDSDKQTFTHWLEYDDDSVRVVENEVAVDSNFGGSRYVTIHGRQMLMPNKNNAYILSYVRRADCAKVLAPVPTDVIPEHVKCELRRVLEHDERQARLDELRRQTIQILIATDSAIDRYVRAEVLGLFSRETVKRLQYCTATVVVNKDMPAVDLFSSIASALGPTYQPTHIRLWRWHTVAKMLRISTPLPLMNEISATPWTAANMLLSTAQQKQDIRFVSLIYVERVVLRSPGLFPLLEAGKAARLFVKYFRPRDRAIGFLGSIDVELSKPFNVCFPALAALLGQDVTDSTIAVFRETDIFGTMVPIRPSAPALASQLSTGDVIVVEPLSTNLLVYRCKSIQDLIEEQRHQLTIQVRNVSCPDEIVAHIHVLSHYDYDTVCDAIYQRLKAVLPSEVAPLSPMHMLLFRNVDYYTPAPSDAPIRSDAKLTVQHMCSDSTCLFFQTIPHSRKQAESVMDVRVRLFHSVAGAVAKDASVKLSSPFSWQTLVQLAHEATPLPTPPHSQQLKSSKADAANEDSPPASTVINMVQHYVAVFVLEGRNRPIGLPVDIDMSEGAERSSISRPLSPCEWVYLYPFVQRSWHAMIEDSDDEENSTPPTRMLQYARPRRIPVTFGEFHSGNSVTFFGHPFFITIDTASFTARQTTNAVLQLLQLAPDSADPADGNLMLAVCEEPDHLGSEREVDAYCFRTKIFCFGAPDDLIYKFLEHHRDRFFLFVNRKAPKEKPGSRYVAATDVKLVLEKKKAATPQQPNTSA